MHNHLLVISRIDASFSQGLVDSGLLKFAMRSKCLFNGGGASLEKCFDGADWSMTS